SKTVTTLRGLHGGGVDPISLRIAEVGVKPLPTPKEQPAVTATPMILPVASNTGLPELPLSTSQVKLDDPAIHASNPGRLTFFVAPGGWVTPNTLPPGLAGADRRVKDGPPRLVPPVSIWRMAKSRSLRLSQACRTQPERMRRLSL